MRRGTQVKGIVLAGGTGSRLWPLTKVISKQLLPVYDKPMIYYPISTLLLAGIRDIAIVTTPEEQSRFKSLLGTGSDWGVSFTYVVQAKPTGISDAFVLCEEFLAGSPSILILGDNLFVGAGLGKSLARFLDHTSGARILGYHVKNPSDYGVVEVDEKSKVLTIQEKPIQPRSNLAIPGLYVVDSTAPDKARQVQPSARGEKEITEFLSAYLLEDNLQIEVMQRGSAWMDMGNPVDLAATSDYIKVIEQRQGTKISCPEEIAWRSGWINDAQLIELGNRLAPSSYGKYLGSLLR